VPPFGSGLVAAADAGFDLLIVAHVASALVGFGAVAASGIQATRLSRAAGDPSAGLRRYFAPGANWAGRVLYLVPAFGFALLADSGGRMDAGDPWVVAGLVLWSVSMVAAEALIWPAERRIQAGVAAGGGGRALRRDCLVVAAGAGALVVAFVAATVLMVAKPG
jgi:hypothetical protein